MVSPITAALCSSDPLPAPPPASIYFFALSQAPPELAINIASKNPVTRAPAKKPPKASLFQNPITRGKTIANPPGSSISLNAAVVAMSTHSSYSGTTPSLPSLNPGISLNCLLTSSIILKAALPTAFIVIAANKNGNIPPRNNPRVTSTFVMFNPDSANPALCTNAENKARAVTAADPIANPFAIAAVVFPRESNSSVAFLTSGSKWAISAIPPALSAIGP